MKFVLYSGVRRYRLPTPVLLLLKNEFKRNLNVFLNTITRTPACPLLIITQGWLYAKLHAKAIISTAISLVSCFNFKIIIHFVKHKKIIYLAHTWPYIYAEWVCNS